jgi:hypothetical protein
MVRLSRRSLLLSAAGGAAAPLLSSVGGRAAVALDQNIQAVGGLSREDFTIVMMPDTQHAVKTFPTGLSSQIDWILANKASSWKVRYVVHVGDVIHDDEITSQWTRAQSQFARLGGRMPYAIAPGNHDFDNEDFTNEANRSLATYNSYFPYSKFDTLATAGEGFPASRVEGSWHQFTAGGTDWGIICLSYEATAAERAWANTVVAANPMKQFIVVTHSYMSAGDGQRNAYGDVLWNSVIRNHPNIFMVLCGHSFTGGPKRKFDIGVQGNRVEEILADYQNATDEVANSYFRIMKFRPTLGRIDVITYSFQFGQFLTDAQNQFTLSNIPFPTRAPQVRRHIINPTVLAAWRLTGNDVWNIPLAEVQKYPDGVAISAAPDIIYTSGRTALYMYDNGRKRHIVNPRSFRAWRLTGLPRRALTAAQLDAIPTGPAWPAYPHITRGDGTTACYILDDPN